MSNVAHEELGAGIGLRTPHYGRFLEGGVAAGWLEAITENFLVRGGRPLAVLDQVRRDFPVALHGVSLSIGGVDPLSPDYLRALKALVDRVEPWAVSDHLCWGVHRGRYGHDLWPMPFTEESLAHVVERVQQVQELLGRRLLLENVSSYLEFSDSTLTEWDFLSEVATRADCHLLLDVNNVYVSARNHGFDPEAFLAGMPAARVRQYHLAGHSRLGTHLLDTHDGPVSPEVWSLFAQAVARFGPRPTLLEWDDQVPELDVLLAEAAKADLALGRARTEATR